MSGMGGEIHGITQVHSLCYQPRLQQLCVHVGATRCQLVNSYPPGGGVKASPYGVRLVINPFDRPVLSEAKGLRTGVGVQG